MLRREFNEYDETQIKVNSFYDVFPDKRTEEELLEYKKMVGMPFTEDYEELVKSLR